MKRIISISLVILMCVSIVSCSSNRVDDEEAYINDEIGEDIYDDYDSNKTDDEDEYEENYSNKTDKNTYENDSNESSNELENSQSNHSNSVTPAKTYGLNETWVVAGKFEFKITSIVDHMICYDLSDYFSAEDAVMINYEIKNLGVSPKIRIYYENFELHDQNGQVGETEYFPGFCCDHDTYDATALPGSSVRASVASAVATKSNKVTIIVTIEDNIAMFSGSVSEVPQKSDKDTYEPSSDSSSVSSDNSDDSNNNTEQDPTLWTYDEVYSIYQNISNLRSDLNKASNYFEKAREYDNFSLKKNYTEMALTNMGSMKKTLESIKGLLERKRPVELTGEDSVTLLDEVNSLISVCDEMINAELTESNYRTVEMEYLDGVVDLSNGNVMLTSVVSSMLKEFT